MLMVLTYFKAYCLYMFNITVILYNSRFIQSNQSINSGLVNSIHFKTDGVISLKFIDLTATGILMRLID